MSLTNTVILGGGFGGISAANTLRRLLPAEHTVTVIDRTARFHVGAGKSWLMLGQRPLEAISQARADLLASGVRLIESEIRGLDLTDHLVSTDAGLLSWDHLVIALGAEMNLEAVEGLAEAAHTFYTIEGAQRLHEELQTFTGGKVVILIPKTPFKCPPAPYEAAMLLHEWLAGRDLARPAEIGIYTVEGAPMATAGEEMGRFIRHELAKRGIGYFPHHQTVRVAAEQRIVEFADGIVGPYDLLIAVPPHVAPKVVADAGLLNPAGWIAVEPLTLHLKSGPAAGTVFAIGDIAAVPLPGHYDPDVPLSLPKAGVFAEAQGRVVAHQIAAKVLNEPTDVLFDGKGYCYLEVGGGRAVRTEGAFFAMPHPVVNPREPDEWQLAEKHDWVASLLKPIT